MRKLYIPPTVNLTTFLASLPNHTDISPLSGKNVYHCTVFSISQGHLPPPMASGQPPPRPTPTWGACTRRRRHPPRARPTSRAAAAATPTPTRPNSSRSTTDRGRKSFSRTSANFRPRQRKSSSKVSSEPAGLLRGCGTNGKRNMYNYRREKSFLGGSGVIALIIIINHVSFAMSSALIILPNFDSALGYSCALVSDILLQGHLYITENYFAFHSNVFGYVTKVRE